MGPKQKHNQNTEQLLDVYHATEIAGGTVAGDVHCDKMRYQTILSKVFFKMIIMEYSFSI